MRVDGLFITVMSLPTVEVYVAPLRRDVTKKSPEIEALPVKYQTLTLRASCLPGESVLPDTFVGCHS